MQVDNVLILGAGFGTRMGPVGEQLPKLLWPIFEKSLLELQVDFAKRFARNNIYINTHYQADLIHDEIAKKNLEVIALYEESILDIGGGIHNCANEIGYEGNLLILNGDQFLFADEDAIEKMISSSESFVSTLLGLEVEPGSNYNRLVIEENLLKSIEKPNDVEGTYLTYSGVSIINLNLLKKTSGYSKFFDTVANFEKEAVKVIVPEELEYADFGTCKRYIESMRKVLSGDSFEMRSFLLANKAYDRKKQNTAKLCYDCKGEMFSINLTGKEIQGTGAIVIENSKKPAPKDSVVMGELISY
ncbi:sugar phosphate nucleotidyltransferase [Halobacteriovorax sp. HLS]|uniref:nucleotidyltransferase family protein n=1 Tax=Halobacteriovorax sp. HLS TaxID=2234000 RepID=UPI000FDA2547|nr:sugar phosphate nucleotidyltransferase [Halobacteriovorax sp. HLS]